MKPSGKIPDNALILFRCTFEVDTETRLPLTFSADERAQLFLDGQYAGEGPERGCPERWYKQTVTLHPTAGKHVLTGRVLCFDDRMRAHAQMSIRHGFYIEDTSGILKNWEYKYEPECEFSAPYPDWGACPRVHVKNYDSEILRGGGDGWKKVEWVEDSRELHSPDLPPMRREEILPDRVENGLYYFTHYVLVWIEFKFTGHGTVRMLWSETPYLTPDYDSQCLKGCKGNRNGTFFIGNYDEFEVDGELEWFSFRWYAGHYMKLEIEGDVRVEALRFFQTGYPYECRRPETPLMRAAFETLQMCSYETYMDCPFYEQLLYIGDARLEALCTYSLTSDHRLVAKCLRLLLLSQREDGSVLSQYPSKGVQVIPSYMMICILMFRDWFCIHGRDRFFLELFPRIQKLMEYLDSRIGEDGLVHIPGWNFIDWCEDWNSGVPPGNGPDSILNLFMVLAYQAMNEMTGEPCWRFKSDALIEKIAAEFYDPSRKLLAIDSGKHYFSEHSQVLALLAGTSLPLAESLKNEKHLTECGIYFSFYYLEACLKEGLGELFGRRMARYEKLLGEGLTTLPEEFENPRSDCHAWSSHILYFSRPEQKKNRAETAASPRPEQREPVFS